MSRRYSQETTSISIRVAVRRSGLTREVVQECVRREIVREPLTEEDLLELRRIRRLRDLGVNMPGIEIILHMRRRIQALQAEMDERRPEPVRSGAIQIEIRTDERWQRLLPPTLER
jgi:hypothetical protein